MRYELEARYDSHKSFYRKAYVETWGGWGQNANLYSYDTLVAQIGYMTIDGEEQFCCILHDDWNYSPTTLRHVKEFLRQFGFGAMSKSDIMNDAREVDGYLVIVRP